VESGHFACLVIGDGMALSFVIAESSDAHLFRSVEPGVFDSPIDPLLLSEFLNDPRHHIAIAHDDGLIVGFVSALDYVHPDKPRELWINEVGVAAPYRRRGVGKELMTRLLEHARALGCKEAWVLTDGQNEAANALYRSIVAALKPTGQPQTLYSFQLR